MPVFNNNILAGASGATGGGDPDQRSVRFNSGDSSFFNRTPSSSSNQKTWTWSAWVKRSTIGAFKSLFGSYDGSTGSTYFSLIFTNSDKLRIEDISVNYRETTQVFRDVSSWYHIVLSVDTTNTTANDRIKLYVNGSQVGNFSTTNNPSQNADLGINGTHQHGIGKPGAQNSYYFDGLLADVHMVDGQALTYTAFTEFDTNGVLQPKAYSGTYGTNGFHLDFKDNSTSSALGNDAAGSNNWTVNNLAAQTVNAANYYSMLNVTPNVGNAFVASNVTPYVNTSTWAITNSNWSGMSYYSGTGAMTFTPTTSIPVTNSLIVYFGAWADAGYTTTLTITYTDSTTETGSFTSSFQNYMGVKTASNASGKSIQSISVIASSSLGYHSIGGIVVDGSILVNVVGVEGDSLVDSPSQIADQTDSGAGGTVVGNYASWNPLDNGGVDLSNGNLDVSNSSTHEAVRSTIKLPSSGKWYAECTHLTNNGGSNFSFGVDTSGASTPANWSASGKIYISTSSSGRRFKKDTTESVIDSASHTGDVLQVAYDADNQNLYLGINNTWYNSSLGTNGDPSGGNNPISTSVSNGFLACNVYSATGTFNAGQRPFTYSAPTGFKSLNTANLPTPTIADGSQYFDAKLYAGNSGDGLATTQDITTNFAPAMVWLKSRTDGNPHTIFDTVRGAGKRVQPNSSGAETTKNQTLQSFNTNGFTVNGDNSVNDVGQNYVSWNWAGGTAFSNSAGSNGATVASSGVVNQAAGFSICTYTGTGSAATIGHGLNIVPSMYIIKNRTNAYEWGVYHIDIGTGAAQNLNSSNNNSVSNTWWNNTTPTSSVFSIGTYAAVSQNNSNFVAYCFAPVEGYSAVGSYTGNGSSDGPAVFTGMRPAFVLVKSSTNSEHWVIWDTSRSTFNQADDILRPNDSAAELSNYSGGEVDILSNGFKLRGNWGATNGSGQTYIYLAFASHPFKTARAR